MRQSSDAKCKEQSDSTTDKDIQHYSADKQRQLYDQLVELLSLAQYRPLTGGEMTYRSKAERAKCVSKSKRVHALADQIIELAELFGK